MIYNPGGLAAEPECYEVLYALARALRPALLLETGTGEGQGARTLAEAAAVNGCGRVISVDSEPQPLELAGVELVEADSLRYVEELREPVGLAFVDCGQSEHRAAVVQALLEHGAELICLHDATFYSEILDELPPPALLLPMIRGLAIWQRA